MIIINEVELNAHLVRVADAFMHLDREFDAAAAAKKSTDVEWAQRSERLALVSARRAGWWGVLRRSLLRSGVPLVVVRAATTAQFKERDTARFWRDCARDFRAMASGDGRELRTGVPA